MTARFQEGQEVEVDFTQNLHVFGHDWTKAKIIRCVAKELSFEVELAHGVRAIFDAAHIRALSK